MFRVLECSLIDIKPFIDVYWSSKHWWPFMLGSSCASVVLHYMKHFIKGGYWFCYSDYRGQVVTRDIFQFQQSVLLSLLSILITSFTRSLRILLRSLAMYVSWKVSIILRRISSWWASSRMRNLTVRIQMGIHSSIIFPQNLSKSTVLKSSPLVLWF